MLFSAFGTTEISVFILFGFRVEPSNAIVYGNSTGFLWRSIVECSSVYCDTMWTVIENMYW